MKTMRNNTAISLGWLLTAGTLVAAAAGAARAQTTRSATTSTGATRASTIAATTRSDAATSSTTTASASSSSEAAPQPNLPPEDGQWTQPAKDFRNLRYSRLTEINEGTAKDLKVAWTFSVGVERGQEAAPIVVGDTMYVVGPFPNVLYALDLKDHGALKWKYEPLPQAASQGVACCDVVNRGCFYDNGKIYYNTLDCHTVCIDAATGKEVWKTKIGDINKAETITMAPLVVKGKVLVGNSGGEYGVRGWLTALNANDGTIAWRAYSTGSDQDCLIGPRYKPFYDMDKGKDLGISTWPGDHWKIGGGTVWGFLSYDAELDLIYYGTANPGSWNPELRPGDNKWSAGVFARDPDDGQAVWYYQYSPHDLFDHDGVNEQILVDLPINGQTRKVILHPDRNGLMYMQDRATGEVISADEFARVTTHKGVDLKTGRLKYVAEKEPKIGKVIKDVAPASPGAKDWQPAAFSPRTGWLYVPHQNLSCDYEAVEAGYIEGTPYVGVNEKMYAGLDDPEHRGYFTCWDPVGRKIVWRLKERFPCWSGTVVTAGDVAFYGTMEGWFKCISARTGQELWKFKCGSGIVGQPTTFKGPDGKQYVAILSGVGGWAGVVVSGDLDPRDPTSGTGFGNAMADLKDATSKGSTLYVFGLP